MALRRGMMRKLGISDQPDLAQDLAAPLRTTLPACTRCTQPDLCAYWLGSDASDAPMFCCARIAFDDIGRTIADTPDPAARALTGTRPSH